MHAGGFLGSNVSSGYMYSSCFSDQSQLLVLLTFGLSGSVQPIISKEETLFRKSIVVLVNTVESFFYSCITLSSMVLQCWNTGLVALFPSFAELAFIVLSYFFLITDSSRFLNKLSTLSQKIFQFSATMALNSSFSDLIRVKQRHQKKASALVSLQRAKYLCRKPSLNAVGIELSCAIRLECSFFLFLSMYWQRSFSIYSSHMIYKTESLARFAITPSLSFS